MKLELKHIIPYLPYELKVDYNGKMWYTDCVTLYNDIILIDESKVTPASICDVKPILRPLSSMTEKELEELEDIIDCNFYIYVSGGEIEIEENTTDPYNGKSSLKMETLHRVYEWLFSHHFDVFNLIDRGLAVIK